MADTANRLWRALFPREPRGFPFRRSVRIALRTTHILTTGVLFGGYVFDVASSALEFWLWSSVVSGLLLFATDLFATLATLFELHGVAVIAKLALLACVPVFWDYRVSLLVLIFVIGGISSHMPSRFRHKLLMFEGRIVTVRR